MMKLCYLIKQLELEKSLSERDYIYRIVNIKTFFPNNILDIYYLDIIF